MSNQRLTSRYLAGVAAISILLALPLATAAAPSQSTPKPTDVSMPYTPDAVTQHSISIDGRTIEYTARVGTITLKNDQNQPTARMSYVAYTVGNDPHRPVTFLYNGGPGSSTMWLLMGSVGPEHVVTAGNALAGSPPFQWVENHDSILNKTDLVFIDMPNTGFGRIMGVGTPKDFFGLSQDAQAFAQFIERYCTAFHRWNSPKFLFGESYGTPRSAELSAILFNDGVALNGIVSQSSILDFQLDWSQDATYIDSAVGGDGTLGYVFYFPTEAATAWYHDMVPHRGSETAFIQSAAHFALTTYYDALLAGDTMSAGQTRFIAEQIHDYIGIPVQYLVDSHLMIPYGRFLGTLMRAKAETLGRYDARFAVHTLDPGNDFPEGDASDDAMDAPYTSAVNQYLRDTLKYNPPIPYKADTYDLIEQDGLWSWQDGENDINVAPELAQTMSDNPKMRVFSANGYYDFATPWLATKYTLEHLNLSPELQRNISFGFYQSGHMIYLNQSALDDYHRDLERWYSEATGTR